MVQLANSPQTDLWAAIQRAAPNPAVASMVYRTAVRSAQVPKGPALPLFRLAAAERPSPQAQVIGHDLGVYLSFLGADQAPRARMMLAPAIWLLVLRMGGWGHLHGLPRAVKMYGLAPLVAKVLPALAGTRVRLPELKPVTLPRARQMLARWVERLPELAGLPVSVAVDARVAQGSLGLLLDRVVSAVDEGTLPASRAGDALVRLVARCPGLN